MDRDEWGQILHKMEEVTSAVRALQEKHREMKELIHKLYDATPKGHGSTLPEGTGACPVCTGELVLEEEDILICLDCGRSFNVDGGGGQ